MITKEMIDRELRGGLSFICACCERYYETTDKMEGQAGCSVEGCGGPLSMMSFPKYKGPLTTLSKYCFICGIDADATVEFTGGGMVGICEKHIPTLKRMLSSPKGAAPVIDERVVFAPKEDKEADENGQ